MKENTEYTWVDQPSQLVELIDDLKRQKVVAVDTESNSLFAYREQVCLIQFSTLKNDYLVDPLKLPQLSGLGAVFFNPKIEKVFHAAEYDLICLKRDFGFKFLNIFDTMHAGRVLGRKNLGLAAMLEENFGLILDKKFQRANWGQRPLPDTMKDYAHIDSHYLISLRNILHKELSQKHLLELAAGDFKRLANVQPQSLEPGPDAWQVTGCQKLDGKQCAVLKKLWEMREKFGRQQNRPVFKIMSTQDLLELAQASPQNAQKLMQIETVSHAILLRYQEGILSAVREGLASPPVSRHHTSKPSQAYLHRVDLLKHWRTQAAKKLEVESDVILPRETLEMIARENPKSFMQLRPILAGQHWRWKNFSAEIIKVLNPKEKK